MKIVRALVVATVLLLMPAYAFSADPGWLRMSFMDGDVQIRTPEAEDWGLASMNAPLGEGDQIWVPEGGRAEFQLNWGTYIRLDENSALQILSMDKDSSQFYLSQGHAYIYYSAPAESVIQIDTPDASTRAFERAVFRIDVFDQYTEAAVYEGYVETENRVGHSRIEAGEMLSLGPDTDGEVAPMGPPDEWEKWNKMRNDRIFERRGGESSRYLPPELSAYSYDFDSSGRWVNVPEFGYCWTPTVFIGTNWAPYREGRWIWRGGDYVWVAHEPWGWAPYHYGRWSFIARIGWCWIPPVRGEVYWGPGYVGWVRTGDYVAWVPLAPGETYYGRGYYGRHSVNITNININQVRITNVYKNVYVNNGVTVVNRRTFATASPKIEHVDQNIIRNRIFVKKNISVGTPAIKPTKSSYFVSDKRVPQAKLPPQRVKDVRVKELKQSRPFVRQSEKSVLNRGEGLKPLPLKTVTTPRTSGKERPKIQRVQPSEKGKSGISGPAPTEEKRVKPPVEKRPVAPEGGPAPKEERRVIPPVEKRPVAPEGGPAPKEERRVIPPKEKKPAGPEQGPATKGEKQIKPESRPAGPEVRPAPKVEKKPAEGPQKGQKKQKEEELEQ